VTPDHGKGLMIRSPACMEHSARSARTVLAAATITLSACGGSEAGTPSPSASGPSQQDRAAACDAANTLKRSILTDWTTDQQKLSTQSVPCALTPAEKTTLGPERTAYYADKCAQYKQQSLVCSGGSDQTMFLKPDGG
jgi:hypothetical protein